MEGCFVSLMESGAEAASAVFGNGFNCAQSVLSAFCEKYGMDKETALKISCGLGSGFRSGEVCGAASGAVLVVGLKYGHCLADDKESKASCYEKTEEFLNEFRKRNGSIVCRDLLGVDISTDDGRQQALDRKLFTTTCDDLVRSAATILEELGY